jgi:hypothetical protein
MRTIPRAHGQRAFLGQNHRHRRRSRRRRHPYSREESRRNAWNAPNNAALPTPELCRTSSIPEQHVTPPFSRALLLPRHCPKLRSLLSRKYRKVEARFPSIDTRVDARPSALPFRRRLSSGPRMRRRSILPFPLSRGNDHRPRAGGEEEERSSIRIARVECTRDGTGARARAIDIATSKAARSPTD